MFCHSLSRLASVGAALLLTAAGIGAQVPLSNSFNSAPPRRSRNIMVAETPDDVSARIEQYSAELRADPNDASAHNNLAVAYTMAGRLDEALKEGLRSLELEKNVAGIHMNVAVIYRRMGNPVMARERAAEAARLSPGDIETRIFLCGTDIDLKRADAALKCFRAVARDFPVDAASHLHLGAMLTIVNKLPEARTSLETARSLQPRNPDILNTLGIVYFGLKEYKLGAAVLKDAVETDPDNPKYRYNLALCYLALKNREAALSQYSFLKEDNAPLASDLYRILYGKYIIQAGR